MEEGMMTYEMPQFLPSQDDEREGKEERKTKKAIRRTNIKKEIIDEPEKEDYPVKEEIIEDVPQVIPEKIITLNHNYDLMEL